MLAVESEPPTASRHQADTSSGQNPGSQEAAMMDAEQLDRDDILRMARLAGLNLPRSYEAEPVEADKQVRRLVMLLPQPHSRGDEPAHIFDPGRFGPTTGRDHEIGRAHG